MSDFNPPEGPPQLDPITLRLTAANALIRRRRTIKPADMSQKPVENVHLAAILENANWAPTHGMTEPWRFFIFTGEARRRLGKSLQSIYNKTVPAAEVRPKKFDQLESRPLSAPVSIVVGMKRQESEKIPEIEEVEAVACAIHNMHLTASALGMAAFWATPPVIYTREMTEWLELEEKDQCLGIFYLGWPREEMWPESTRGGIEEKIIWMDQ